MAERIAVGVGQRGTVAAGVAALVVVGVAVVIVVLVMVVVVVPVAIEAVVVRLEDGVHVIVVGAPVAVRDHPRAGNGGRRDEGGENAGDEASRVAIHE